MTIPNITFIRLELARLMEQYTLIRDCLEGETTVKAKGTKYLPMPNTNGDEKEEKQRYAAYKTRATFYNVTRRTLAGLIGQVFMRPPLVKLPTELQELENDATGSGVSLVQESKRAVRYVIAYARSGVFVDFPKAPEGGISRADIENGTYRPTINVVSPFNIINWRIRPNGAKDEISLVVLAETYVTNDDGFEMKNSMQIRVLRLVGEGVNTVFQQEIWREDGAPTVWDGGAVSDGKRRTWARHDVITPTGADGQPLKVIPFQFIGSDNNDSNPDQPNMYDLSSLNVAHYRNSADYEESCFIMGQPTVALSGLTEEWVTTVLKGKVAFGARGGIPLPVGASAAIVQAGENTMIKEAMDTKERQMVALGAKLVEQKEVQRTAFEAKQEGTASNSTLASSTKNVSTAFEQALKWALLFTGGNETEIQFQLNTDFDIASMTPEERNQAVKEWQAGAIAWEEMRDCLRKGGSATMDDTKAQNEIAKAQQAELELQAEFMPQPTGGI